MSLINPSIGECIDRLTILARKIQEAKQLDKDWGHWWQEEQEISNYLLESILFTAELPNSSVTLDDSYVQFRDTLQRKCMDILEMSIQLAAVNAMLWEKTNEMNRLQAEGGKETQIIAKTGVDILYLNKFRCGMSQQLTFLAEGNMPPEEKI